MQEENMYIPEEDELDALLAHEDQELEALVALMEEEDQENHTTYKPSSHFGSDIDDYDAIFSEMLSSQTAAPTSSLQDEDMHDAMDTSGG